MTLLNYCLGYIFEIPFDDGKSFQKEERRDEVNRDNGNILLDCRMDHFHYLPSQFQINRAEVI